MEYAGCAGDRRAVGSLIRAVSSVPLHWSAGGEYALLAIRRLVDDGEDVRFDIIGDGPDRERLVFASHDLELQHVVRFHRQQDRLRGQELLSGAEVFVLAALQDRPWPQVIEAMAAGLPVVGTDLQALRRVVEDGAHGLLVPRRDPGSLARALGRISSNPEWRMRMGAAAHRRAAELAAAAS